MYIELKIPNTTYNLTKAPKKSPRVLRDDSFCYWY